MNQVDAWCTELLIISTSTWYFQLQGFSIMPVLLLGLSLWEHVMSNETLGLSLYG